MNQIEVLGHYMSPNRTMFLLTSFEESTLKPNDYMMLFLRMETVESLRINGSKATN